MSGEGNGAGAPELSTLLEALIEEEASDLHLAPDHAPLFRIDGTLRFLDAFREPFPPEVISSLAKHLAGPAMTDTVEAKGSVDGAVTHGEDGRFRYNIYRRLPGLAIAIRRLENRFRSLKDLGLPQGLDSWCDLPDGLVLVAGPTGSGKSTTLATLLDQINRTHAKHIITIEDPIEYLHISQQARIDQRQIGAHAFSFQEALISSLRQDPDVILVGEVRERETIRTALTAAETGHLVFTTVHAPDCAGAIQRIASAFPADEQPGILRQLSMNLRGVLTQHLIPADGPITRTPTAGKAQRPRIPLCEILQNTPAAANLIAKGQYQSLYSVMETGSRQGMQTLEQNMIEWVQSGSLLPATAFSFTKNPGVLEQRLAREASLRQSERSFGSSGLQAARKER
ncbi:MAG: PilT/PilU family type 4a pilus ATPase [Verrucomicrobiota bacterium]